LLCLLGMGIEINEEIKMAETVQTVNSRVRINLSQTAKGLWQIDCTSEFPTLEEARDNLSRAIDETRAMLKEKNLEEAHG